jgi:rhomboid family GlyGly-CTERM serine protease
LTEPLPRFSAWAWSGVASVLIVGALLAWPLPRSAIDWQPALAAAQPWRAWSAVFVHFSALHLGANLAGALLVAVLGQAVPVPARCAVAWLIAWPLTQAGLLAQPALAHYGGLSGVLHAGVAVVAVHLLLAGSRAQRRIAAAIAVGLALKLLGEAPWEGPLRHPAGWDIAIAPLAHVTGTASGAICAALAEWWCRARPNIVQ